MRASTGILPEGNVVLALTGRDRGGWFLTVAPQSGTMLYLADGAARTAARPKKKNIRHVRDLGRPEDADDVLRKLRDIRDEGWRNAEIRACIERYRGTLEAGAAGPQAGGSNKEEP
ncbi:MAG: hypothetical protein KBA30_04485 [Clostridia bacterium]|nr:hypothetical protein [Clostridia bacterium]